MRGEGSFLALMRDNGQNPDNICMQRFVHKTRYLLSSGLVLLSCWTLVTRDSDLPTWDPAPLDSSPHDGDGGPHIMTILNLSNLLTKTGLATFTGWF